MKQLGWLVVLACACGGKGAAHPSDLGTCAPYEKDGKAYYLCERTGSAPIANTSPATTPPPRDDHEAALRKAETERDEAMKEAQEAMEKVEKLGADLSALESKVTAAVDSVVAAQNDADRAAAKAKLAELQREQAEMKAKIAEAKAAAEKAQRKKGTKVSQQCLDNPLAKGCE